MKRVYENSEINFVKINYKTMTINQMAETLQMNQCHIKNIMKEAGLVKQQHKKWTDSEIQYVKENYNKMTAEEIGNYLNRSRVSVYGQIQRLNLTKEADYTDDEIQFIKDNYLLMTHKEIGEQLNRTAGSIRSKCMQLNLNKKELPWTEWETEFLIKNYASMNKNEIAETLNRSVSAIQIRAHKHGLKKSPYTCNYHFFDDLNTEDKAYWFGFLMADGWTSRNKKTNAGAVGIDLQYRDINHLRKFNKSIGGNYKITDRWRKCTLSKDDTKHHYCTIRIFSHIMYESLEKLGFNQDKTFNCRFPKISNELLRHFLRGYFDGDGCFGYSKNRLGVRFCTASKLLNDDIVSFLKENNYSIYEYYCINDFGTTMYYPEINRGTDKIRFLDYLYQDSSIYLDRKYYKYLKVKEDYNAKVCRSA